MGDVKLLATWDGWCGPCTDERPLVLTALGPRGLRAWLQGLSDEDRELRLTCRVCGRWQLVPHDEADDLVGLDEPVDEPEDEPSRAVPVAGSVAAPERDLAVAGTDTDAVVGAPSRPASAPAAPAVPATSGELDDEPFDPLLAALSQRSVASAPSLLADAPVPPQVPQPPLVVPALSALAAAQEPAVAPARDVRPVAPVPQLAPPAGPLLAVAGPRVAPSAPTDLAAVLELLSQGLEMSGPGRRPQQ